MCDFGAYILNFVFCGLAFSTLMLDFPLSGANVCPSQTAAENFFSSASGSQRTLETRRSMRLFNRFVADQFPATKREVIVFVLSRASR